MLNPEQTNDLYFVANGQGGHVFAATIAEHAAQCRRLARHRARSRRAQPCRTTGRLREQLPEAAPRSETATSTSCDAGAERAVS